MISPSITISKQRNCGLICSYQALPPWKNFPGNYVHEVANVWHYLLSSFGDHGEQSSTPTFVGVVGLCLARKELFVD